MPDGEAPVTVRIERELSADRINAVLNHPGVREWVADPSTGPIDVTDQVANTRNILLMGDFGGCLFLRLFDGLYEVHTQFVPEGRGTQALAFVRAAAHWMFTRSDAFEILTRVPEGHVAAKALSLAAGMQHEFRRPDGVKFKGNVLPVDIYGFRIQDWIKFARGLEERGAWFHAKLGEEAKRLGITSPAHAPDPNHDRYVGLAWDMIAGGQPAKGVMHYNRWALVSRHAPIFLTSLDPIVVKMDIGAITLKGPDNFEVTPL